MYAYIPYLQLVFEGIRGSGTRSDVAIDDVSVSDGACALCK